MSGITTFEDGDMFIFRVYADQGSAQGPRWSNTFEAYAHDAGVLADLVTLGTALTGLVQGMSHISTRITGFSVATWVPDSTPYNPENFYVSPALQLEGARGGDAPLDLDVTLNLRRSVNLGRAGNIYLRGSITERDVERMGSKFVLTDPEALADELDVVLGATHIPYYYLGGSMVPVWLGLIGKNIMGTVHKRGLTSIAIRGVTIVPMNHKWYNQPNRSMLSLARKAARAKVRLAAASEPPMG